MCTCIEVQHKVVDLVEKIEWNVMLGSFIMLCSLVQGYEVIAGNHCLHLQIREVKHVSEKCTYLPIPNYAASHA
jgi:hypothetical protein